MYELKITELIKLPFKNIYLFLLVTIITLCLTFVLLTNYTKKYTFYGAYNMQFFNLEKTQKQVFKNYLAFNYGDNFVEKDSYFILYNLKYDENNNNAEKFFKNYKNDLMDTFYESTFFQSYINYVEKENSYIKSEINRIEESIKNINDKYLTIIDSTSSGTNLSITEIQDIIRSLIYSDGDFRSVIVDLSKTLIDLKSKSESNDFFIDRGEIIDGKLHFTNQITNEGFYIYFLSFIIAIIICFIFNFSRLKLN